MLYSKFLFLALAISAALLAFLPAPSSLADGSPGDSPWSLTATSSVATSLYKFETNNRTIDTEFALLPKYQMSQRASLSLNASVSKGLSGTRQTLLNDAYLSYIHNGGVINNFIRWGFSSSVIAPLSIQSRKNDSLLTAIVVAPSFVFNLKKLGIEHLVPSYTFSLSKSFHQYSTSVTGKPRKEYNLKNRFDLTYFISEVLDIGASYTHATAWTYQGTRSNAFSLGQYLSYKVNRDLYWSVGHENGGNTLRANGQDSNISFINPDASSIYTSLRYRF